MGNENILWGIAPIGWRNDDIPEIGAENTLQHLLSGAFKERKWEVFFLNQAY
jgi:hypothetical protein